MNEEEKKVVDKIITQIELMKTTDMLAWGGNYIANEHKLTEEEKEDFIKKTEYKLDFVIGILEHIKEHSLSDSLIEKLRN